MKDNYQELQEILAQAEALHINLLLKCLLVNSQSSKIPILSQKQTKQHKRYQALLEIIWQISTTQKIKKHIFTNKVYKKATFIRQWKLALYFTVLNITSVIRHDKLDIKKILNFL